MCVSIYVYDCVHVCMCSIINFLMLLQKWISYYFNAFIVLSVCFPSQLMKHFRKSFTRRSKLTNALSNQNYHGPISLLRIMLGRFGLCIFSYIYTNAVSVGFWRINYHLASVLLQVQYQSEHFLDKNKDYVVPEHQDLLSASKCPFVAGLFPPLPEETTKSNKSSKFSSIGSRFKVIFCFIAYNCRVFYISMLVSGRPFFFFLKWMSFCIDPKTGILITSVTDIP